MNHDYFDEQLRGVLASKARPGDSGESTLAEADRLVNGDRQAAYGHPLDLYTYVGRLWGALLQNAFEHEDIKLVRDGEELDFLALEPEEVVLMMDQLKLAREMVKPKRDNRVDGPGYWGCLELIHQEKKKRAG